MPCFVIQDKMQGDITVWMWLFGIGGPDHYLPRDRVIAVNRTRKITYKNSNIFSVQNTSLSKAGVAPVAYILRLYPLNHLFPR